MQVTINDHRTDLPPGATVAQALAHMQPPPQPPFAVAVNTTFVPRGGYASQRLQEGDRLEVIAPVTGG